MPVALPPTRCPALMRGTHTRSGAAAMARVSPSWSSRRGRNRISSITPRRIRVRSSASSRITGSAESALVTDPSMELQAQSAKCSTSNTSEAMADCSSIRIPANLDNGVKQPLTSGTGRFLGLIRFELAGTETGMRNLFFACLFHLSGCQGQFKFLRGEACSVHHTKSVSKTERDDECGSDASPSHAQPAHASRTATTQSQLAYPICGSASNTQPRNDYREPPKSGGPSRQTSLLSLHNAADRMQSASGYETNAALGLRFDLSGADPGNAKWSRAFRGMGQRTPASALSAN